MSATKAMAVLFLLALWSSPLVTLGSAADAEGDLMPLPELGLEVLALLEDIVNTKLCSPACVSCLVKIGKACPLTPALFGPCALGRVFADGCFNKK